MAESNYKTLSNSGPLFSASQLERSLDDALDELRPGAIPEVGGLIGNKYRVERLIARGGMGAVYAATHNVSSKRVAVKWMLPALGQIKGARERFIREACATARIAHPNIVDIYDVGSESGSVYLVMEYLRGETLSQRISRCELGEQEAIRLLMPAMRGVAAAHAHGVIHRDLKPDNIFLCCNDEGEELEPKVLDFGISKITTDEARDLSLTHSGAVLGTPYYMSPEQVRGARDVDARADVYAFGVMLFEALTGQRPFDAETYNELILKIATESPPKALDLNPTLNPDLIAVIERAMARDPDTRFQTIESLAVALEPFGEGVRFRTLRNTMDSSIPAATSDYPLARVEDSEAKPRIPTPIELPNRRTRAGFVAAALGIALGGALGMFLLRGNAAESAPLARPAPQPQAAAPEPEAQLPVGNDEGTPRGIETSVLAAQGREGREGKEAAQPLLPDLGRPTPSRSPASAKAPAIKRTSQASTREKRWNADPPAPEATTPGAAAKRALPRDWDDRLSTDVPRGSNSADVPAGKLDQHDFR